MFCVGICAVNKVVRVVREIPCCTLSCSCRGPFSDNVQDRSLASVWALVIVTIRQQTQKGVFKVQLSRP